ncbi:MAG: selenide, water dikinase SelD [Phycisphaerae bacterium]|nr:selenide, water dikinase SelD [Phycisphaerae bacterium]
MERSIRLGHCICDPKTPCPCDLLRQKDVCLCAGERVQSTGGPVRLTHLVEKAGCASKIDQAALRRVLQGLPVSEDPKVLIGVPAGDDAGVYSLGNEQALVQTVDVFTPSVDDPYLFGQIAAANSVSDVYAMGGEPITALSIVGFPIREVPDSVLHDVLRGGIDKMAEAGVAVIGGHSVQDREIKAGFAVTGLIDPRRIVANAGVRPGDALVLTKALGTGVIAFAAQIDRCPPGALEAAARSMTTLNKAAAELMFTSGAHACTDITGFGLMGHLTAMAAASEVDVEVVWDDLPLLPGVLECLVQGILPGGVERNRESSGDHVSADGLEPVMLDLCFDPQTSGGLLIALPENEASRFVARLRDAGMGCAAVIGRAVTPGSGRVTVRTTGQRCLPVPSTAGKRVEWPVTRIEEHPSMSSHGDEVPCCSDAVGGMAAGDRGVSETQRRYQDFLKTVNQPGALDAHTKQAIAIALSVMARCEPCLKMHLKKAREKGFCQDEIDEAAWMAISFGGSPLMVWYNAHSKG